MSDRSDKEFVADVRGAIQSILTYTADMTYEAFIDDPRTQDAVIRNLEIVGEATKNLSEEFRAQYSIVPWKSMAGTRDRLIHHYFGVNIDIVWQITKSELPAIARQLQYIGDE